MRSLHSACKYAMWPMTKCLQNRICHFVFASLSKVYLRQIHKYKTSFNAHRSSWIVRRWWLWRFRWSDATLVSEINRSMGEGEPDRGKDKYSSYLWTSISRGRSTGFLLEFFSHFWHFWLKNVKKLLTSWGKWTFLHFWLLWL